MGASSTAVHSIVCNLLFELHLYNHPPFYQPHLGAAMRLYRTSLAASIRISSTLFAKHRIGASGNTTTNIASHENWMMSSRYSVLRSWGSDRLRWETRLGGGGVSSVDFCVAVGGSRGMSGVSREVGWWWGGSTLLRWGTSLGGLQGGGWCVLSSSVSVEWGVG